MGVNSHWNKHEVGFNLKETWSNKAVKTMKEAIRLSGENVHKPYDLFKITEQLEKLSKTIAKRDVMRLNYTGEIKRCIEWMIKNEMI